MKILTITCHRVFNHGASLQQFALLRFLQTNGFNAKTVNYQPSYLADNYTYTGVTSPRFKKNPVLKLLYIVAKFPSRFGQRKRRRRFDAFENHYIPQTAVRYKTNEELKKLVPQADVYITGSDQVWNTLFENGKDPAFYLDWVPQEKTKISYAPSFATDVIAPELHSFVKDQVAALDSVSVRESSAVKLLNDLGIKEVHHVLDPVFLLSAGEWKEKFIEQKMVKEPYVLVYDFDNDDVIRTYAEELQQNRKLKIVSLNRNLKYADQIFWDIGPQEFLNLMYYADFVLGNSFHATAFSVIFKKNFFTFNRNSRINTRMRDFLAQYGLQTQLKNSFESIAENHTIDYTEAEVKLTVDIQKSKEFLIKSIHNEKLDY